MFDYDQPLNLEPTFLHWFEYKKAEYIYSLFHPRIISLSQSMVKGYFHLCPRMDFLQTLHIYNSLNTKYEHVYIELDS